MFLPLYVGVVLLMQYLVAIRAGCFSRIVFLMSCCCKCSVTSSRCGTWVGLRRVIVVLSGHTGAVQM